MRSPRLAAAGILAVLSWCAPARAAEPVTLAVGHAGHDHHLALFAAAEAGRDLEARAGVRLEALKDREVYDLVSAGKTVARVTLLKVEGGSGIPAAMERGDIEVGLGGIGPIAKFADRGVPIRVLAPLNNDGDAMVLRPGAGASSWPEFVALAKRTERPLRIGYKAPLANAYMILTKALAAEGVTFGQEATGPDGRPVSVVTLNLQGDQNVIPAMEAGAVDGVVVNEPDASFLVFKGLGTRIADLSDLPPEGAWRGHPCCVVAATDKALAGKPEAVGALLRAIASGADIVRGDREAALRAEGRWTKVPPEVGRQSIPAVSYVIRPDGRWLAAVEGWLALMQGMNRFDREFKGRQPAQVRARLVDTAPFEEALTGVKFASETAAP